MEYLKVDLIGDPLKEKIKQINNELNEIKVEELEKMHYKDPIGLKTSKLIFEMLLFYLDNKILKILNIYKRLKFSNTFQNYQETIEFLEIEKDLKSIISSINIDLNSLYNLKETPNETEKISLKLESYVDYFKDFFEFTKKIKNYFLNKFNNLHLDFLNYYKHFENDNIFLISENFGIVEIYYIGKYDLKLKIIEIDEYGNFYYRFFHSINMLKECDIKIYNKIKEKRPELFL